MSNRYLETLPMTPVENARQESERRREINESDDPPSLRKLDNAARAREHSHYDARANLITVIKTPIEECPVEWCQSLRLARVRGEMQ